MDEASTAVQVMEWIKFLVGQGVLGVFAALVIMFVWKKAIPWLERYIVSVEKLHDSIGEKMGNQLTLCGHHGKVITDHDASVREAAVVACKFLESFVEREFPNSRQDADEAFGKIRRIMGEP